MGIVKSTLIERDSRYEKKEKKKKKKKKKMDVLYPGISSQAPLPWHFTFTAYDVVSKPFVNHV